ncbi:MAG: DNA-binding response regulator [Solirubrobacterales bacterium]|nr:DNA-binding response regulator [Solirubrobacterales bacterium]
MALVLQPDVPQPPCEPSIADLVAICDPGAAPAQRAAVLLRRLAVVVPHAAAAVSFVDARTGRHRALANRGYAPPVLAYLLDGFVAEDPGWRRVRRDPHAVLSWHDVPGYAQSHSARDVFGAEGYREGTSVALLDKQGELVGAAHLSVGEPQLPEAARTSLAALRATFAALAGTTATRLAVALSGRELQIVRLIAAGQSNAEIAQTLVVARRTVATHVEHILAKLGARNRADAAVRALRLGLL